MTKKRQVFYAAWLVVISAIIMSFVSFQEIGTFPNQTMSLVRFGIAAIGSVSAFWFLYAVLTHLVADEIKNQQK